MKDSSGNFIESNKIIKQFVAIEDKENERE
jgi:hypothetical protein